MGREGAKGLLVTAYSSLKRCGIPASRPRITTAYPAISSSSFGKQLWKLCSFSLAAGFFFIFENTFGVFAETLS